VDVGLIAGIIAAGAAVVGAVIAVLAWRRPKAPADPKRAQKRVSVAVAYNMPLFDLPDGSQEFADDMVAITVQNATDQPVKVNGWGVHLPGNWNLVVREPGTGWEPRLPAWVQPGDDATWYLLVSEVRSQAAALGCFFDSMKAYISLADGRELVADRGMPLK